MSTRMNSVRFTIDFTQKRILGTKTSLKKAQCYGSAEYNELCKLLEVHPRFSVVEKEIRKNKSKETYKDLDTEFIKKYISIQPDKDELMREYNEIKKVAVSLGKNVYPYTKKWFLKKFSTEDKPFDMKKAKEDIDDAGFVAAQAKAANQPTQPTAEHDKESAEAQIKTETDQTEEPAAAQTNAAE